MHTWSAEELFIRAASAAAVGVQGCIDFVNDVTGFTTKLEQLTRPSRRGAESEDGTPIKDGADWLADKEAEEDVAEPGLRCYFGHHPFSTCMQDCQCPEADTPNPTEPSLSDDELVGVRGLLQERYGDQTAKADKLDAEMWRAYVRSQSTPAASAAGSSSPVDDGHSPVPPTGERSRWDDCGGGPW